MGDNLVPTPAPERSGAVARGVAASAVIVAVGQLLSRLMGLGRVTVIANVFGAAPEVSSFVFASRVPTMVYDFLLGGMISAALVPVLSEYAGRGERRELEEVTSVLLTLVAILFGSIVVILELGAPLLAVVVGGGFGSELLALTTRLIRLILPSLAFLCIWGVAAAVLYARQQFVFPALASAVFNLGVILAASIFGKRIGVAALSLGVVLGSLLQLLIIMPGLRDLRLRPRFDLRHPVLRRIAVLYMPVAVSLLVTQLGYVIDSNLASRTVEQAAAWMQNATFLFQLPFGLVSVAIATATLPTLARITDDPDNVRFRHTLAGALRLVIVLVVPATVGLLVLGQDAIRVALEHGAFTPFDTAQVTRALLFYLPGLPFAAIDQPLVFAFYARQNTVTPVLVGIAGVGAYLLVGPFLAFVVGLGYIGLVIANAVQLISHCILMWLLLERRVGSMAGHGLLATAAKTTLAAAGAGVGMLAALGMSPRVISTSGTLGQAATLTLGALVGAAVYVLGLSALRVEELATFLRLAGTRLRRPMDDA